MHTTKKVRYNKNYNDGRGVPTTLSFLTSQNRNTGNTRFSLRINRGYNVCNDTVFFLR